MTQKFIRVTLVGHNKTPHKTCWMGNSSNRCRPGYLASELQRVSDLNACRRCALRVHTSALVAAETSPATLLATVPSRRLPHPFGTICRSQ